MMETTATADPLLLAFGAGRCCPIWVGAGVTRKLPELWHPEWQEAALIGDATVIALYGESVAELLRPCVGRLSVLKFAPGEAHKTRATKEQLEDALLAQSYGRQCCIVALGGGISLDLAGFVAATYLRGVPFVNIPTSLLAQVDAAVGGKTGLNTAHGKNLIGAVHQPAAVLVDPLYLETLARPEWLDGLAELVKHAVIADAELFAWIAEQAATLAGGPVALETEILRRNVAIKGEIVQQDEHEQGIRSLLNYGHTVGHALEKASQHRLSHGQAVAVGMAVEGELARTATGLSAAELVELRGCLAQLGLPVAPPPLPFAQLEPYLERDKKRRDGALRLALPARLGCMARDSTGSYTHAVALEELRAAWQMSGGTP